MSIRPKIEAALSATAERLSPGSGDHAVHHAKNDLVTIQGSSENFDRRYADDEVLIAAPAVVEAKHPDGDPVTVKKRHDGLIVVFADSFIFVRGIGFGAREVKSLRKAEVSVERVTIALDGAELPGLRISGGGTKLALAPALEKATADLAAQEAVRDEIDGLLTS